MASIRRSGTMIDASTYIVDSGDTTKRITFDAASITTGTTRTLTAPNANTTILGTDATQDVTNKTFDSSNLILGNSGPPSTPAAGYAKLYGIGTSNLRPGWMNEGATNETIITNGGIGGAIRGLVAQRQGSTTGAGSWNTPGTNNTDTSTSPILIQVGSVTTSGSSATTVTFPTAYTQPPVVFTDVIAGSNGAWSQSDSSPTTTTCSLTAWTSTVTLVARTVQWVAIGY